MSRGLGDLILISIKAKSRLSTHKTALKKPLHHIKQSLYKKRLKQTFKIPKSRPLRVIFNRPKDKHGLEGSLSCLERLFEGMSRGFKTTKTTLS